MASQHSSDKSLSDCDVEEVLALCGGDAIAALRIVLIANAMLEGEIDRLKVEVHPYFRTARLAS